MANEDVRQRLGFYFYCQRDQVKPQHGIVVTYERGLERYWLCLRCVFLESEESNPIGVADESLPKRLGESFHFRFSKAEFSRGI